jgi:hypothetical protein
VDQFEITKSGTFAGEHLEEVRLAFRQDFTTSMTWHIEKSGSSLLLSWQHFSKSALKC